nr:GntR family transcriptional regulator [uncultured Microbacterium sp.]
MVVPASGVDLATDTESLSDVAFGAISSAICDGTLEPGETLHLVELQTWLGISRTPIREAIVRLARIGLIVTQPGRYTKVSLTGASVYAETVGLLGYQGAFLIRRAASRFSDPELQLALTLVDRMSASAESGDSAAWRRALRQFLEHVWSSAGSGVARQVLGDMPLIVDANLRHSPVIPADNRARVDGYQRLRDALAQRDPDYADYAFRVLYPPCPGDDDDFRALPEPRKHLPSTVSRTESPSQYE